MVVSLDTAQLESDLDCRYFNLLNVQALIPVPEGLVIDTDPRLSDPRPPLDGSVTNASVAATAGIVQSKLNLNGSVPPAWIGTGAGQAAAGNLTEYVSRKGAINGYASLDGTGKVPASQLPALVGVGTVTSVGLAVPAGLLTVTGSPITSSGVITLGLASAPAYSWFGNNTAAAGAPAFRVGNIPVSLIPNLDASIITTGIFNPARIPLAQYGPGHNAGAIPDPGAMVAGTETDTLCRDLTYRPTPTSGKVTMITTPGSGSFTPDPGMRALLVELWGGGGGGGGAICGAGNLAAASGGAGGGYATKWITAIQGFYNYVVGTGGAGGTAGNPGQAGNPTTFMGGPPTANGGAAGNGDNVGNVTPGIVRNGGTGGTGAGDMWMAGGDGGDSIRWDGAHGRSGDGGGGAAGAGGSKGRSSEGVGVAGNNYGGGGSGALSVGTGFAGGAGFGGAIRITQYF